MRANAALRARAIASRTRGAGQRLFGACDADDGGHVYHVVATSLEHPHNSLIKEIDQKIQVLKS